MKNYDGSCVMYSISLNYHHFSMKQEFLSHKAHVVSLWF